MPVIIALGKQRQPDSKYRPAWTPGLRRFAPRKRNKKKKMEKIPIIPNKKYVFH